MDSLIIILAVTVVPSAIIGMFFVIWSLLNRKTARQCCNIFVYSFIGGIIGGLAGALLGLIIGNIIAAITPHDPSFLGAPSLSKAITFMIYFLLVLFVCVFIGAILGGIYYVKKGGN